MRLGIFGGTFDPPHIAHLILASEACAQLGLERILWVLTHYPPHKSGQPITLLSDRLDMLQAALNDDPAFELSRVDIDRSPPHYTVDTMHLFREQFPEDELVYLMGGDSLVDLPLWYKPRDFVRACNELGVMRRPGWVEDLDSLEQQIPGLCERVRFVDAPLLDISSSQLRCKIIEKSPFRYYLPSGVYDIIRKRKLYINL